MNKLQVIKLLLGYKDDSKDIVILFYINLVEQKIKNYCNREDIPEELDSIIVEKVVGLLNATDEGEAKIKSIAVGGTTTSFETSVTLDTIDDIKMQLSRFRKVLFE